MAVAVVVVGDVVACVCVRGGVVACVCVCGGGGEGGGCAQSGMQKSPNLWQKNGMCVCVCVCATHARARVFPRVRWKLLLRGGVRNSDISQHISAMPIRSLSREITQNPTSPTIAFPHMARMALLRACVPWSTCARICASSRMPISALRLRRISRRRPPSVRLTGARAARSPRPRR